MGLTDLTGLGLTREFAVLPHYDDGQLVAAREWGSDHGVALLGIPERSGLVTRDGCVEVTDPAAVMEFNGGVVTVQGLPRLGPLRTTTTRSVLGRGGRSPSR